MSKALFVLRRGRWVQLTWLLYMTLIQLYRIKFRVMIRKCLGYTAGVFDLFHIGHLNILKAASQDCDRLIVGVTTDELCEKEKKKRPVIPFQERCEIVSSIKYVDQVIPQHSIDKFDAWQELGFNKIYVGNDWKGTQRWVNLEKRFAEQYVKVVYLPYTNSTSSSLIREILQLELLKLRSMQNAE